MTSTTLPLIDTSRPTVSRGRVVATTRTLTTLVWSPAVPGRWPLVVFAHGYDVSPAIFAALLGSWAARGYVVAAPAFPLADPAVAGANLDEGDLAQEPADLRFVLFSLLSPGRPLRDRIDAGRVAVAGHSDGAEVALSVASASGPGIKAVIAMSGQPLSGSHRARPDPEATSRANPPLLVTQGNTDTVNRPALGVAVYTGATAPKYLLTLRGAGHLPPLLAGSAWLPAIEKVTGDFLDAYVADAPGARVTLSGDGNGSPLTSLQAVP